MNIDNLPTRNHCLCGTNKGTDGPPIWTEESHGELACVVILILSIEHKIFKL